jgi:hypothetical protein
MFTKVLKHDFKFSYKVFFAMFAGLVALAAILRISEFLVVEHVILREIVLGIAAMAVIIASYFQILIFFQRNFFGPEGYLMLTLPVKRGKLLASKFLVSMAWFNFMMLLVPVMVLILVPPRGDFWAAIDNDLNGQVIVGYFEILNMLALGLISILFLTVTLANSVFFGKKVHGVIAGVFSAGYHLLFFWLYATINGRFMVYETHEITGMSLVGGEWTMITSGYFPQIGWQYGRIPFEFRGGGFIDIFTLGYVLGFVALTIAIIMYLLKKRIALR